MNGIKETVKKINILAVTILLFLCYFLCHTILYTIVRFLPWLSILILIGCVLYIFVAPIVGWLIWGVAIILVVLKSLVDVLTNIRK